MWHLHHTFGVITLDREWIYTRKPIVLNTKSIIFAFHLGFRWGFSERFVLCRCRPSSISEIKSIFQEVRKAFPGAVVVSSTFDAFAAELTQADIAQMDTLKQVRLIYMSRD